MQRLNRFFVTDGSGGFDDEMNWMEAERLAKQYSKKDGKAYLIQDGDTHDYVALFFEGERYIKATGQSCQSCGVDMDADKAAMAYELTGQFFCSEPCGVQLGVLMRREE